MIDNLCQMSNKIYVLITIVNRNIGEQVAALYRQHNLNFNMISPGFGAAGLEILDYLGLSETEKDVVISIGSEQKINELLPLVNNIFELEKPGKGIAFTIPVCGISGSKTLRYILGNLGKEQSNYE